MGRFYCLVLAIFLSSLLFAAPPTSLAADEPADGKNAAKAVAPKPQPPAPRTRQEVDSVLGIQANDITTPKNDADLKPLKIVLLAGKKDHGVGEHDYPAWQTQWKTLFEKLSKVSVSTAYGWPSEEQLRDANLIIAYYWNHEWTADQFKQLDDFLARGGGLVHLHAASIHDSDGDVLAKRLGLAFQQPKMKWRHGPVELKIVADENEPITRRFPRTVHFHDEAYWLASGDKSKVNVLATSQEGDESWPMIWTFEPNKAAGGKGRVVCHVMGHYMWSFDDPLFRTLVLRSAAWSAGEPVNRFEALATDNVRIVDDEKR